MGEIESGISSERSFFKLRSASTLLGDVVAASYIANEMASTPVGCRRRFRGPAHLWRFSSCVPTAHGNAKTTIRNGVEVDVNVRQFCRFIDRRRSSILLPLCDKQDEMQIIWPHLIEIGLLNSTWDSPHCVHLHPLMAPLSAKRRLFPTATQVRCFRSCKARPTKLLG